MKETLMRHSLLLCVGLLAALPAFAEDTPDSIRVPPPPPISGPDAAAAEESNLEPQVSIIEKDGEEIQEYRINGKLYKITVKPKVGPEYHLIDDDGSGAMKRTDNMGPNIKVPQWVIKQW